MTTGFSSRRFRLTAILAAVFAVSLPIAGCGGPDERAASQTRPTPAPKPALPTQPGETPTRAHIIQIQTLLRQKGYDPGPVDGIYGRKTGAAIGRYQAANNLPVDGNASLALLEHLRNQPAAAPEVIAVEAAVETGPYEVGERYVFSGGTVHDVVGRAPGRVKWHTSDDEEFTAPPHFGLPATEWRYEPWQSESQSTLAPETPWPPAAGTEIAFDVNTEEWNRDDGPDGARQTSEVRWNCRGEGRTTTETIAGSFTVDIVTCERWPVPAGAWQKRTWHYAPAVGHFVKRIDLDSAGLEIETLELTAALPGGPRARRTGLANVLRDLLDNRTAGQPLVWNGPGASRFVLEVKREFKGPAGMRCRAYGIDRTAPPPRRSFPAVSCYNKKKKHWRVPGLE